MYRPSSRTASTPGKTSDRVRERSPSATTTTSKVRAGPWAKGTVTPRAPWSRPTIWLPKTYSVSSRVRSTMMRDSWPRTISSSAVAAPEAHRPAGTRRARAPRADGVRDAHAAGDPPTRAADVDVLTVVAELGEALDDGGLPTLRVQPVGQCRAGEAGSGAEDARWVRVAS